MGMSTKAFAIGVNMLLVELYSCALIMDCDITTAEKTVKSAEILVIVPARGAGNAKFLIKDVGGWLFKSICPPVITISLIDDEPKPSKLTRAGVPVASVVILT